MRPSTITKFTVGLWRHLDALGPLLGGDGPGRLSLAVLFRDNMAKTLTQPRAAFGYAYLDNYQILGTML
jgi:hypothetical protein